MNKSLSGIALAILILVSCTQRRGDSLFMEEQNGKPVFSGGQSAVISAYYENWEDYLNAVADTADYRAYYSQSPTDFIRSVGHWIEVWKQPLLQLQQRYPDLNARFVTLENERIKYRMYGDLNDYKRNYVAITGETPIIPENFYQYLDEVNLNDTNLIQFEEYRYFLCSYVYMKTDEANLQDKTARTSKMLDVIQESFHNPLILNEISKEVIRLQTSHLGINDSLLERFRTLSTNMRYVREIEKDYGYLKPLQKGNEAPDFELTGMDGEKIGLRDFKGKYLLIDVWSTSCPPCIREIPAMDMLKNELTGKNIAVIAACLSDEPDWEKALEKYGLVEGQYRVEDGWNSKFCRDYLKSSGVPVYILIDPRGVIIDARAPYPSENLYELISSLDI
jgi:thiol-disulfide isomerase/thioredoxin